MLVSGGVVGGAGVCSAWASEGAQLNPPLASGRLGRWWPQAASFEVGGRRVARHELVSLELRVSSSRPSTQAAAMGYGSAGRRSWERDGAFAVAPGSLQQRAAKPFLVFLWLSVRSRSYLRLSIFPGWRPHFFPGAL